METIDVLMVAPETDLHASQVERCLRARKKDAVVGRLNLDALRTKNILWTPNQISIGIDGRQCKVGPATTIWLRRVEGLVAPDMEVDEANLLESELMEILRGIVETSTARLVDPWGILLRAESKMVQLQAAMSLEVRVPATIIASEKYSSGFLASHEEVLAKPLSSGPEPAGAHIVTERAAKLLAAGPALIQEAIRIKTDLRVVTVGPRVFVWERQAHDEEPIDWRGADPRGEGFRASSYQAVQEGALKLARHLGLSMSVQDWLLAPQGLYFLEVNPQGQWLFLHGSEVVAQAIADHLIGDTKK